MASAQKLLFSEALAQRNPIRPWRGSHRKESRQEGRWQGWNLMGDVESAGPGRPAREKPARPAAALHVASGSCSLFAVVPGRVSFYCSSCSVVDSVRFPDSSPKILGAFYMSYGQCRKQTGLR